MINLNERYTIKCILKKDIRGKDWNVPRVLLKNIVIEDKLIRDHTWVKYSKQISPLLNNMVEGEEIEITFHARVEEYICSRGVNKIGLRRLRGVNIC